ncbi:MAG: hypothetical protein J1G05_06565 [Clostridiales bacterium]|nr:hypothetical protein [Clostridiales bacterium]
MQTKYPIVLVHGIALKEWKIFKSFGRIERTLREAGYKVYAANTDGFGSIENNAKQLKTQIEEILQKECTDKVNIIAHSKGGLDSKYMIKELGMAGSVASLTTLSTPHRGSRVASKIYSLPRWITRFIAFWINLWYRIFGDKHPDALTVCEQLQLTENDELDILTVPDGVYCQSYSATMEKSRDDFLMSIPLYFSHRWGEEATDGLVSVESAKYAEYRGNCLDESLSHSEMVGLSLKKKKRRRVYDFYLTLCRELSERGF